MWCSRETRGNWRNPARPGTPRAPSRLCRRGWVMVSNDVRRAVRGIIHARPRNRDELRVWIDVALGIRVPHRAHCPGHDVPLDYLDHVFFERPGNAVVWANRGGGKTFYGAV